MSGYKIKTLEAHRASIEKHRADNVRRLDCDVSDVALSSWASSQTISFDGFAIRALELGAKNGIDGPAVEVPVLRYKSDRIAVEAHLVLTKYGLRWHVDGAMDQSEIGKEWLSTNEKTLEKLGLYESSVVLPARDVADAHCPFVGAPVSFSLRPLPGALEAFLRADIAKGGTEAPDEETRRVEDEKNPLYGGLSGDAWKATALDQTVAMEMDPNPGLCGCRGQGWLLSDFDTWHECRYHYQGQAHPGDDRDE